MLFNSYPFLFMFLPIALAGFYTAGRFGRRPAAIWLIGASFVFYAWWNINFVALLLASITFNYILSEVIAGAKQKPRRQLIGLVFGIGVNISVLIYYKYFMSLIGFLNGLNVTDIDVGGIVLPLGISFFTFTQIGYLVDVKTGTAHNRGLLNYILFVTFFPHLIAGPLLHNREIMPQFESPATYRPSADNVAVGLSLFVMGLAKKCLLADPLSDAVMQGFQAAPNSPLISAWYTALAYTLQLYFDFSGYSDMAIGLARLFNVHFPVNFNSPLKAASAIEFWQRWHMTLSRYLTLYVYGPLALAITRWRSQRGLGITRTAQSSPGGFASMVIVPIFVTLILAGIWHGAGVQFLVFGLLQAMFLIVNHAWRIFRKAKSGRAPERLVAVFGATLLTFMCMLVARVFFRAPSVPVAFHLLAGMTGLHGLDPIPVPGLALGWLGQWGHGLMAHGIVVDAHPVEFVAVALRAIWMVCLYGIVFALPNTQQLLARFTPGLTGRRLVASSWLAWQPSRAWALGIGMLAAVSVAAMGGTSEFLYFQF